MKLGAAAWGLRETSLPEQLSITGELGFEVLELGIGSFRNDFLQADAGEQEICAVEAMFRKAGLVPVCGAAGNDFTLPDAEACAASLDQTLRAVRIAERLHIRTLRIFSGFAPVEEVTGERWERMIAYLKEVYRVSADTGVIPAVETHGGVTLLSDGSVRHFPSVSTRFQTLARMLEAIPVMLLNFDPANLFVLGMDVCAFFRRCRERIVSLHLKDFIPAGEGFRPAACGKSAMDWDGLLEELGDFSGPALLEYEVPGDVKDGLRESRDFLWKRMAKT